jgi:hypothetical protein
MAKEGKSGIIKGGSLDPYVAQSLTAGRAGAENRLATAMRERGETERTKIRAGTQARGQDVQAQVSREQIAASTAQQDKQLAAQERARREQQTFQKTRDAQNEAFITESNRIQNEFLVAERDANWKRQDELREEQRAYDEVRDIMDRKQARENYNAFFSLIKTQMGNETAREKAITTISNARDKHDKDKQIHARVMKDTLVKIREDKRMDLPTKGRTKYGARVAGSPMGFSSGFLSVPTGIIEGSQADPIGVLQSQLTANQVPIQVDQLTPEGIASLEKDIVDGKVAAEDIRTSVGVFNAMLMDLEERKTSASEGDRDFWRMQYNTVEKMKRSIVNLRDSEEKIGDGSDSVKKLVSQGLEATDPIYDKSLGAWVDELKASFGTADYSKVFDAMTKGMEPTSLFDITDDLSKKQKAARERMNAIMKQSYPDRYGEEIGGI